VLTTAAFSSLTVVSTARIVGPCCPAQFLRNQPIIVPIAQNAALKKYSALSFFSRVDKAFFWREPSIYI
jgi:hypothetical protein